MKYNKLKQIARLSFFGNDAIEPGPEYSSLTFGLFDLTQIPLSDNAYISLESITFDNNSSYTIRCDKFSSKLLFWDSANGCRGPPILYSNIGRNNNDGTFYNPDPSVFYKFPIDKNFFNSSHIKFSFDNTITTNAEKNRFSISFVVYEEEDEYIDLPTEVKKDDWKTGKSFPQVY